MIRPENETNDNVFAGTDPENLTVALLLSDLEVTRNFSKIFRKVGVVPHYYEDLQSFWNGILDAMPSLVIVDVLKMSDGNFALPNHPYVKSGDLPVAFFYTKETAPLVNSTYNIFNLGLICGDQSIRGQLKAVLTRANRLTMMDKEVISGKIKYDKMNIQMNKLVNVLQENREKEYCSKRLADVCKMFEELRSSGEPFENLCANVFEKVDEIEKFSMMELSTNSIKLHSPKAVSDKFIHIPSVWLGQKSENGIEHFAQTMATQVASELFGSELICLLISGTNALPDVLLFVSVSEVIFLEDDHWDALEGYLSGVYAATKLAATMGNNQKNLRTPWDLMSKLDERFFSGVKTGERSFTLIDIDFSFLLAQVSQLPKVRFYWNVFYREFFARMESLLKQEFVLVNMGVHNVGILVEEVSVDEFFPKLKEYCKKFSYWRFFEDGDLVLTKDLYPTVKTIPPSAVAYARYLEGLGNSSYDNRLSSDELSVKNFDKQPTMTSYPLNEKTF